MQNNQNENTAAAGTPPAQVFKTAKITSVITKGSFTWNNAPLYKWEIEFDNGDKGEANTKETPQKRYIVGETIRYEIKQNGQFTNIKRSDEQKPGGGYQGGNKGGGGYKGLTPEQQKEKEILIVLQNSLGNAVKFHEIAGFATDKTGRQGIDAKHLEIADTMNFFADQILHNKNLTSIK